MSVCVLSTCLSSKVRHIHGMSPSRWPTPYAPESNLISRAKKETRQKYCGAVSDSRTVFVETRRHSTVFFTRMTGITWNAIVKLFSQQQSMFP